MQYLEKKQVVHRDLALRNLLVSQVDGRYLVKVSDFGLSKRANSKITAHQLETESVPLKW